MWRKSLDCCALSLVDGANPSLPADAIVWQPGRCTSMLAQRAAHVCVPQAELANGRWGASVAARAPRRLTVCGNSHAFASPQNWFAALCAAFPERVRQGGPRRVPWHALSETLSGALEATAPLADVRVLAASRSDAAAAMEALRGSPEGVRVHDPVWHWRLRRVGYVQRMTDALGCELQAADLDRTQGLRLRTTVALAAHARDVNVALVQTPATLRGSPDAIIVLPGVPPCHTLGAEQHAREALVGVGRAFQALSTSAS